MDSSKGISRFRRWVAAARHLVQALMQGPAEGDVHLPADPEQRHAPANRAPHEGEAEVVTAGVADVLSRRRLLAVVMRLDVRHAAGQHDAVDRIEHGVRVQPVPEGGDEKGQGAGGVQNRDPRSLHRWCGAGSARRP